MRNIILLTLLLLGAAQAQQFTVVHTRTCVVHDLAFEKSGDWCRDIAHAVTFDIGTHGDVLVMPVDASNCGAFGKPGAGPSLYNVTRAGKDFTDDNGRVQYVMHAVDNNGTPVQIRRTKDASAVTTLVYPTYSIIYDRPRQ